MSALYSLALTLLFGIGLTAQQVPPVLALNESPAPVVRPATTPAPVNRMVPAFPGGNEGLAPFLRQELDYPELAREYAIEGTVVVEVEVDPTGKVKVIGVQRKLFAPLDEAALAAAARLPRLLPARENGVAVSRAMMIPFHFSLR